jgi:hypothetical protein
MNGLLEYLNLNTINENEQFIDNLNNEELNSYPIFIKDIIEIVLKDNPNIKWQKCSKCNTYYPYHKIFFNENQHSSKGLNTFCKECQKYTATRMRIHIIHPNKELNSAYWNFGEEVYLWYRNHETIKIYEHYINSNQHKFPNMLKNKEDYLKIIKYGVDKGIINELHFSVKEIMEELKLTEIHTILTASEIYECICGKEYRIKPWKYPSVILFDLTFNEAKEIFNSYLKESNIIIDDIYEFHYIDIITKCGLKKFTNNDLLNFIMKYYDNKYAAYKFTGGYENYWKNKDNANQALKFFIEEDLQIPLEKIPLYITLNVLGQKARTLYNLIYNKRFHNSLFEWINDIYPGKFIESDFHIGVIRNKFDSVEEEQIYNLLKDEFDNVIYNKRNTDNTVKFCGMIPDYLVFNDKECIICEYFGLYVPDKAGNNKRINDYIKKTDNKIEKYNNVGYKKIFMYPDDIKDDMRGVKEKINIFKN